jgi:hypothetical protein
MRRCENVETEARRAPEERAAQEYLRYFEQRSDEAARRSDRIGVRSRRTTATGSQVTIDAKV